MIDKETKFCKYCGEQIDFDSIFCSFCGKEQSIIAKEEENNENTETEAKKESIDVNVKFATPKIPKPDFSSLSKKKSESKYDEKYTRDYSPTIVGVILGILVAVANFFGIQDPEIYSIIVIFLLLMRIFIAIWCSNLSKTLNRGNKGWGAFGFFLPVVALIIIGFKKKLKDGQKSQEVSTNKDIIDKSQYVSVNNLPDSIADISVNESYSKNIQEASDEFLVGGINSFEETIHKYDSDFPLMCAIELDRRKVRFTTELLSKLELYSRLLGFYSFIGMINSKLRSN
jgi:hypothetical protein